MKIKTFQDLERAGSTEEARMEFIKEAIDAHKTSEAYRIAADAEEYYAKKNVTISEFQKFLYNIHGQKEPDLLSANYKLKSLFFRKFVIQQVQYVLSNGTTFDKKDTKKRLGKNFDNRIVLAAKKAMVAGVAYCFWNYDHLEVFSVVNTKSSPGFVPLLDENTGLIKAGIRFWKLKNTGTRYATLYELDGYTEYVEPDNEPMRVLEQKRAYIQHTKKTAGGEVESVENENYPGFPIIPMYANDLHESELIGIRESIDCYDYVKSGLANDIDDASEFYWLIKNAGGMKDKDLAQFLDRLRRVKAAVLDSDDGVDAEAHTLEIPVEARTAMLDRLREDLYSDFQIVDTKALSAAAKTATEIRAAYQPMDDKCGDFEYCIRDFIGQLFSLLGIDDEPSFRWNRIANQTEETNMIMTASSVLGEELTLRKLPFLTSEEVEARLEDLAAESLNRFSLENNDPPDGDLEE